MDVACASNRGMRVLDTAEETNVAGGCSCPKDTPCPGWTGTLVHEGEQAPAGSWYLTSIKNGAIFITPAPCQLQN